MADRTTDRHTIKTDRHTGPRKDYHKPGQDRHKNRKVDRLPWDGGFYAIDGEGWNGKYTLLACSGHKHDLYNPKGLSTKSCLDYLTHWNLSTKNAFVGFGLGYDFENILCDVPDEDYIRLRNNEEIEYMGYKLKYIPRKFIEIKRPWGDGKKYRTIFLQDVFGFFQSSFEQALKKWNIPIPPIITEFKALRNAFSAGNIRKIKNYNREELRLLIELMEKLRAAGRKAFEAIGLKANHTPRTWYGPGAMASNFLNQTGWVEEHPKFSGPVAERLEKLAPEETEGEPFAMAYYGGRIEAAALGEFQGPLYDYDINSAYPWAISMLPTWDAGDLVEVEGLDKASRMGMYYVTWDIKEDLGFYPFPYRQGTNVFFPPQGQGWYMSPEVLAALKNYSPDEVQVHRGYVIQDTEGAGAGRVKLNSSRLCTTAKKIDEMATIRLDMKAKKEDAEKALKLILNSCYGKTIQQVGSHKYLNLFAAAWITSVCRSLIAESIGRDREKNVVSIMTDGILVRNPLSVDLGRNLGQFEEANFDRIIQLMPGVYKFWEGEKETERYRGMGKGFDFNQGLQCAKGLTQAQAHLRIFVSRQLALAQHNVYGDKRYMFIDLLKEEKFRLGSKRKDYSGLDFIIGAEEHKFFPAKRLEGVRAMLPSDPYKVEVAAQGDYDEAAPGDLASGKYFASIRECMLTE